MLEKLKTWLKDLNVDADRVAFRYLKENGTEISTRDERPEENFCSLEEGIMVEVQKNEHTAYIATNQLNFSSIQKAAQKAVSQAEHYSQYAAFKTTAKERPIHKGEYLAPGSSNDTLSLKEINDRLMSCHQYLKASDKVISTVASVSLTDSQSIYICNHGSEIYQKYRFISLGLSATAQEGPVTQTRTNFGRNQSLQAGYEVLNPGLLSQRADLIGKQALELANAEVCPSEKMDLVLAPDQMMLQIHESIGHPLEIDRILGDERNYAGSSFVKLEDFGKLQYGSNLLNVVFNPSEEGEFASYAFDDGGMQARKEYIIKEGILQRGLGGAESISRSGLEGVAGFRASSWNRAPIDRMANLNIEAGNSTAEEIISSVERGVYMESNRSWSIDDYRNKFQFGCEYGKLIENGQLTKTVRNPSYRGISTPFWKSLKKVGNQQTYQFYGTPYCGKGEPNQAIRVGHGSPLCLFSDIEVFGGES